MKIDSIQTLTGDLAAWVMSELDACNVLLSPIDRALVKERIDRRAFDMARLALDVIVLEGVKRDTAKIPAILESLTLKADAKLTLKVTRGRQLLPDYVGGEVLLLLAPSAGDLFGEPAARAEEVQSEFKLEGGANDNGTH